MSPMMVRWLEEPMKANPWNEFTNQTNNTTQVDSIVPHETGINITIENNDISKDVEVSVKMNAIESISKIRIKLSIEFAYPDA